MEMNNITNVTLSCDDDQQTGAHKVMELAYHTIKYVKWYMKANLLLIFVLMK